MTFFCTLLYNNRIVGHGLNYTSLTTEGINFKAWHKVYCTLTNELTGRIFNYITFQSIRFRSFYSAVVLLVTAITTVK